MNRGSMRALLRRRLNDPAGGDQWTDAALNELINYGLQQVEKEVLKRNPEAFLYVDRASVVADQELYAWPQGMLYEIELALLTDGEYVPIERCDWNQTRGRSAGATVQYAPHGRYFALSPIPEASIADGLQLRWVPTIELATDSDVPILPSILHPAAVVWAQKLALGETGDALDEIRKEIGDIVGDFGQYYLKSGGRPQHVRVDLDKGY